MGVAFSFVHAADLHLDSPFRGLTKVPEAVRERLRESTFAAFRKLAGIALASEVDFMVVAGDLYDAADRSLRAQLRLQRELAQLTAAGVAVFVVHGNHDPESGRQARLEMPAGVHVFGSDEPACVPAYRRDGQLAAHVYGVSYATAAVTDNLASRFRRREGAPFHLALLHANVDGNAGHDNYAPCKLGELAAAGFDYWALGHVHDRRVLHEYPHVVYPGNVQGRSIKETGEKGAYIVRVSETGALSLSFQDVSDVIWRETAVSIEGIEREQQLKDRLQAAADAARDGAAGRPVVLRIRLEGRGPLHESLQADTTAEEWLEQLREWVGAPEEREDWVWIESLSVRTAANVDLEAEARGDGFAGELVRIALRAAADAERSRRLLEEANDALRREPRIREWLSGRSDEEREALIRRAAERAIMLLKEEAR